MTRPTRFVLSALAALVLLVLVIGLPIVLALAVGLPFPDPWPSLAELGDMVAGRAPVPADLVISVLALVMWLLWFQVAWAVSVEVMAAVRGRLATRAPVLPGLQLTVGKLVTTATLLTSSLSAKPVAAGPLLAVTPVTQLDDAALAQDSNEPTAGATSSRSSGPSVRAYMTEPGDTWWGIAEDVYGSGPRWKEIRNLNLGRTMDDGAVISVATDLLRPQWRLLLPAGAEMPATAGTNAAAGSVAAPAVEQPAMAETVDRPEVVVEAGDTVWALAEDDLRSLGQETSTVAVAERVEEIAEINRTRLDGDPDLIFPGQQLELPARPALAERAPIPETPPVDEAEPAAPADDDAGASGGDDAGDPGGADAGDPGGADEPAEPSGESGDADEPDQAPADDGAEGSVGDAGPESVSEPVELEAPADDGSMPATADEQPAVAESDSPAPDTAESDTAQSDPTQLDAAESDAPEMADTDDSEPAPAAEVAAGDDEAMALAPEEESSSPLSPVGDDTMTSALAGARASSPDWLPSSTPDAGDSDLPTSNESGTTAPASAARTLASPEVDLPAPTTTTFEPTADLPAVGSGEAIDVVVNGSPGSDEGLDTADSRAPIFAGLAAITLVGGYLFRAKGRRRKVVMQSRHPGRRPEPSRRRTRTLTRRLAAAAEPGHPEFVNLGLRALGRLLSDLPAAELPRISGVWVSQNRLVLALSDDTPNRPPPAPFTQFADGSGWSLSRDSFDEVRAIARGANGPLPLLTTVGTTTALDLALTTNSRAPAEAYGLTSSLLFAVDLEAGRVISVEGRPVEVIETLTMMALELATSETADQAEIICVGFGHRLATFDRVMVVDDLSGIMADLEEITNRAVYASGDASPFATRVRDGAADTWNPVIVLHADPDDPEAQDLVDLAERTDGGVTLVCGYPADSGWRFLVDGEGVNCPDLPGSLANHRFSRPRPGEADDLIDLFDDDPGEIDLDDEFWRPLGDEEFGLDPGPNRPGTGRVAGVDLTADRPLTDGSAVDDSFATADVSSPARQTVTVPDRPGGPVGPSSEGELPPLTLRHSVEHRSGETDPPPPLPSQ
ncbi:MAG: LysM peptidoglycan-binding domain-containing protein, partial [Actinomycetota bacterium]